MIDRVKTGKKIKENIEKSGYSVQQISDILEISVQALYKAMRGGSLLSTRHFYTLSHILHAPIDSLIIGE